MMSDQRKLERALDILEEKARECKTERDQAIALIKEILIAEDNCLDLVDDEARTALSPLHQTCEKARAWLITTIARP